MFLNLYKDEVQLIDHCQIISRVKASGIAELRQNTNKIHKLMFDCRTDKQREYIKDFFKEQLNAR